MKKQIIFNFTFVFFFVLNIKAQNTTFNNVAIGTDDTANGVRIKYNFPGYTGGWSKSFSISNENGSRNFISFGTFGSMSNGVTGYNRSYIGRDWNDTFMDFLSNGNVGIGTNNPSAKLSVLGGISKLTLTGVDGIFDNIIKYGYKSDLESGTNYANRWHGIDATITIGNPEDNKLKFRLYGGGTSNAEPIDVMTLLGNGRVGIGITAPTEKLDVLGNAKLSSYSPTLVLQRDTDDGGYTQGIQTKLKNGTNNWYFGNLHSASWIVSKGDHQNPKMTILDNGKVGIGTSNPDAKLTVNGDIHATEVRVTSNVPTPDYVFASDYKLKSLKEVEEYINKNSHLPEIPSAKEIKKNGLMLAEMNMSLLKKVEELTLYMIDFKKEMDVLKEENKVQKEEIKMLKEIKKL